MVGQTYCYHSGWFGERHACGISHLCGIAPHRCYFVRCAQCSMDLICECFVCVTLHLNLFICLLKIYIWRKFGGVLWIYVKINHISDSHRRTENKTLRSYAPATNKFQNGCILYVSIKIHIMINTHIRSIRFLFTASSSEASTRSTN